MAGSTAGARHLAESEKWLAACADERLVMGRRLIECVVHPGYVFGSLIESAALHSQDPVAFLQQFILWGATLPASNVD